jgi:hypothetical protein
LLDKGITLIHVWTTGTDMDTMYHVKEVGCSCYAGQYDHYQKQQNKKKTHKLKPLKSQQHLLKREQ